MNPNVFLHKYVHYVVGNKRATTWWGFRGSTSSIRRYSCFICQRTIDTDSAKNRPTRHAEKAVAAHAEQHIKELMTDTLPELVGLGVALTDGLVHQIAHAYEGETARVITTLCDTWTEENNIQISATPPTCFACITGEPK